MLRTLLALLFLTATANAQTYIRGTQLYHRPTWTKPLAIYRAAQPAAPM